MRALEVAAIQGPDGHGAAVPAFRSGLYGAAAPDTSAIRAREPWFSLLLKRLLLLQALLLTAATPSWASSTGSCKGRWPPLTLWKLLPLGLWSSGGAWPARIWRGNLRCLLPSAAPHFAWRDAPPRSLVQLRQEQRTPSRGIGRPTPAVTLSANWWRLDKFQLIVVTGLNVITREGLSCA
jgi:hypothetical protein